MRRSSLLTDEENDFVEVLKAVERAGYFCIMALTPDCDSLKEGFEVRRGADSKPVVSLRPEECFTSWAANVIAVACLGLTVTSEDVLVPSQEA